MLAVEKSLPFFRESDVAILPPLLRQIMSMSALGSQSATFA